MKPSEVLKCARETLSKPNAWTKRALGRTMYGSPTAGNDMYAVQWCAIGAIHHCVGTAETSDADILRAAEAPTRYMSQATYPFNAGHGIIYFNDEVASDVSHILAVYDDAIALAEANGE